MEKFNLKSCSEWKHSCKTGEMYILLKSVHLWRVLKYIKNGNFRKFWHWAGRFSSYWTGIPGGPCGEGSKIWPFPLTCFVFRHITLSHYRASVWSWSYTTNEHHLNYTWYHIIHMISIKDHGGILAQIMPLSLRSHAKFDGSGVWGGYEAHRATNSSYLFGYTGPTSRMVFYFTKNTCMCARRGRVFVFPTRVGRLHANCGREAWCALG